MKLSIEITGQLERVIVTRLPQSFIKKIFKHCLGKNNTPYFANNCFKGVLYFDYELAIKFAESVGFSWTSWREAEAIYKTQGYVLEQYADIEVQLDSSQRSPLSTGSVETELNTLDLDSALEQISEDDVCILLGSVDKGSETWEADIQGDFDPAKLRFSLDSLENFKMPDQLITGISYDGQQLTHVPGKHTGKNMMVPVLFAKDGRELDLQDFLSLQLEP